MASDGELKTAMDGENYIGLQERVLTLFQGRNILQHVWSAAMITRFAPQKGWVATNLENIPEMPEELGHNAAAMNELKLYQMRSSILRINGPGVRYTGIQYIES